MNLTGAACTSDDPVTNHFGVTAKVNHWSGEKPGDIWWLTFRHGSPEGMITDLRDSEPVNVEVSTDFLITGHPGQAFTVFVTAYLPGSGAKASGTKRITLQPRCGSTSGGGGGP